MKDELLKVDETIHYINKIYNQKKDSENSWFSPDEYVLIKDKYNDRVFEYYGYTEDEGISVNNMEKIIEMKLLKEIKDEINILLNKTEYSFAEIMIAEKIELGEEKSKFVVKTSSEKVNIDVPVGGEHFVYNALCGFMVGKVLGLTAKEIQNGISKFELTKKFSRKPIVKNKNI